MSFGEIVKVFIINPVHFPLPVIVIIASPAFILLEYETV